jgi:hypothetical protein
MRGVGIGIEFCVKLTKNSGFRYASSQGFYVDFVPLFAVNIFDFMVDLERTTIGIFGIWNILEVPLWYTKEERNGT